MPKIRRHKYNAKAVKGCPHCGRTHPSQVEAARCAYWHTLKAAGEILHVDVHPTVTLPCGNYAADFAVWVGEEFEVVEVLYEDVKGRETPDWKLKRKEFDKYHPARPLQVVKGRKLKAGWKWEVTT